MRWSQPEWPQSLPTPVIVGWATLGPLGRRLPAPGTWGSLAGLLYFTIAFAGVGVFGNLILSALGAYVAVAVCGEAEVRLGARDPGEIVLDEVVAMPLCFLAWQLLPSAWPNWLIFLAGFALFRLFDITKPFGIRRLQNLPGGWGVVADDLAAALAACLALHAGAWLWALR
ncbi:MAG: phosphatidylglycerophosphatase A [Opitutaceae bacterium]|nr:phosphatidylglycerophosphatase A [Opitutaceae bacterium]